MKTKTDYGDSNGFAILAIDSEIHPNNTKVGIKEIRGGELEFSFEYASPEIGREKWMGVRRSFNEYSHVCLLRYDRIHLGSEMSTMEILACDVLTKHLTSKRESPLLTFHSLQTDLDNFLARVGSYPKKITSVEDAYRYFTDSEFVRNDCFSVARGIDVVFQEMYKKAWKIIAGGGEPKGGLIRYASSLGMFRGRD